MLQDFYPVIILVVGMLIAAVVLITALVMFRRRRGELSVGHGKTKVEFASADARQHPEQEITADESDVRRNTFKLIKGVRIGIYNSVFRRNQVTIVDSDAAASYRRRRPGKR